MLDVTMVVTTVQLILAVFAFTTNGILVILIVFKSPKTLGSYKFLMIFMSVFEIFYALIDLLVKPEVRTNNSYWISETNSKRFLLPLNVAYPLLLIWACSFGIALTCFGVHFVFRYFIVTGNNKWVTGIRASCLWLIFPATVGCVYALTIHLFLHFDPISDNNLRTEIANAESIPITEIIYFGFNMYKIIPDTNTLVVDWKQICGVFLLTCIITISFSTMIYFGLKGYWAIKKLNDTHLDSQSSQSRNLQTQLFYSLVIQTIIPIALIHFPTTLIFVSAFFGASKEIYGQLITITISLFPAIDPQPSLIIIKPYRQTIKNFLKLQCRNQIIPSAKPSSRVTSNYSGRAPTI